jgi:DNA-binding CsgD family transcriptional regulator
MHVSPRTVYNHITHLKEKLGANTRAQLILKAIELTDENLTGED